MWSKFYCSAVWNMNCQYRIKQRGRNKRLGLWTSAIERLSCKRSHRK